MDSYQDAVRPTGEDYPRLPPSRARRRSATQYVVPASSPSAMLISTRPVSIPIREVSLKGELGLPPQASGLVVMAHANGSTRLSWRSYRMCELLHQADLGTLSVDLLTPQEERLMTSTTSIGLLTTRLTGAGKWLQQQPELFGLRLGLLAEDTGAAAALLTAVALGHSVGAVVSLGGYLELATPSLPQVQAPTLLLVGEQDEAGCASGEAAQTTLGGPHELQRIAKAGHLFQEPSALVEVTTRAAKWLNRYLAKA